MVPADSACDRSGPAFAGRSRPESSRGRRRMRIELLSSGKTRWEWNEECNSAAAAPTPAQASQRATTSGPAGNELAAPAPAIDLRQDLLNRLIHWAQLTSKCAVPCSGTGTRRDAAVAGVEFVARPVRVRVCSPALKPGYSTCR